MQRIGIVDLGSNTARLVVFAYEPSEWFRLIDEIREPIRLGQGLGSGGRLTGAAIDRAMAALRLFADYAKATGLKRLEVLGTSALRDGANREELLERLRPLELGISILSGEEEARLGVSAVANGFDLESAWIMDLGGGSAQLSLMLGREFRHGRAHPLGAVRLSEAFLPSDPPKADQILRLEQAVQQELGPVVKKLRRQPQPLVAMGGTIRNVARAAQKRSRYPLDFLHGYFLERSALEEITDELLRRSVPERGELSGINPDRADVIVAGALVYRWLLRRTGADGIWISGHGMREGAFYRCFLSPPHLMPSVRSFSIQNFLHHYPQPSVHVDQVRKLARRLFDLLEPLHGLGSQEAELLDTAASLHDAGMALGYHHHHKHGAYLLASAPLNGFTHREQALLTLMVRYHRRGIPRFGSFQPLFEASDKQLLVRLTTCLRLAEQLERSRAGRVREARAEIGDREVRLKIVASEEPSIELSEARKHALLFQRAFGRRLILETDQG